MQMKLLFVAIFALSLTSVAMAADKQDPNKVPEPTIVDEGGSLRMVLPSADGKQPSPSTSIPAPTIPPIPSYQAAPNPPRGMPALPPTPTPPPATSPPADTSSESSPPERTDDQGSSSLEGPATAGSVTSDGAMVQPAF